MIVYVLRHGHNALYKGATTTRTRTWTERATQMDIRALVWQVSRVHRDWDCAALIAIAVIAAVRERERE